MDFSSWHASCQPSSRVGPMSAGSSAAGKRGARQAAPRARRGRQGGRSQQVQLVRVGRVDNFVQNFDGPPSRSRSRSGHRSQHTLGLHYQVRLWCYQGRAQRRGRSMSLRPHAAPVAPRGIQTPLTPPSSPPPLPAQELPRPPPPPVHGAASVPSAAKNNAVASARLADFAYGWYVTGRLRALGVEVR